MSNLRLSLTMCHEFLMKYDELIWSKKIGDILENKKMSETELQMRAANLFGGAASLSGVYISSLNNHSVKASEERDVNYRLGFHLDRVYELAKRG